MTDFFWMDWELATLALKGERRVPKATRERWAKEVKAWHVEHKGEEHT